MSSYGDVPGLDYSSVAGASYGDVPLPVRGIGPISRRFRIDLHDPAFRRQAIVGRFSKLEARLKINAWSKWRIDLPLDTAAAELVAHGWRVAIWCDHGDRVWRYLTSGPIDAIERAYTSRPTLTISGPSDDVLLWDALALPDPSGLLAMGQESDSRSGPATTVMHGYVSANLGPAAPIELRADRLDFDPDPADGGTVSEQARWRQLGDLLASIAQQAAGQLVFGVYQSGDRLRFYAHAAPDRTAIKLSRGFGTLGDVIVRERMPEATREVVAGGGEGVARVVRSVADTVAETAWGRRIVRFRDRRDTSDPTVLDSTGAEELAAAGNRTTIEAEIVDTPQATYGIDYTLGDIVRVLHAGQVWDELVREVDVTADRTGVRITPRIGPPPIPADEADFVARQLAEMRRLAGRLQRLEVR